MAARREIAVPLVSLAASGCGGCFVIDPYFVKPVLAQAGGALDLLQFLPFVMIFVIMYFLILRPQQQKLKAQQEMLKNIRRGDTIVMGGGLIGKVAKVTDGSDEIEVEISTGVKVRAVRALIVEVRAKGEPVKGETAMESSKS